MADGRKFSAPTVDHFLIAGTRGVVLNENDEIEILPALLMSGVTTGSAASPEEA